jgi:hypothetical protein
VIEYLVKLGPRRWKARDPAPGKVRWYHVVKQNRETRWQRIIARCTEKHEAFRIARALRFLQQQEET